MNKKYDYMVYVGRFQPPHRAHIATIERALELAEKVIILIGSADEPRTIKDPWTWMERTFFIRGVLPDNVQDRIIMKGVTNHTNDDAWAQQVQSVVSNAIAYDQQSFPPDPSPKIGIIGYVKDGSSFYLKMFPQWKFEPMENIGDLHATDIRKNMFEASSVSADVPVSVREDILNFIQSDAFSVLKNEYTFIQKYKSAWEAAPYPPIFVTADAVVIQSGHVLLIKRKAAPGKGLWAIPGGFVGQDERVRDAAIRELREETKLKVPDPVLRGSIKANAVYDKPDRSLRGRTITHAFFIELPPGPLPKIKGSDDAEKARWIPLSDFQQMREQMFEDHFMIIQDMMGKAS